MGIGIKGVYFGMKSVFYLAPKNSDRVSIDYFHEDGSGGLGGMKQFIVKMTILFSTGIMFYPVVLDMALVTDNVYTKVFLYSTIIGVSLLALTSGALSLNRLYRYAQKKKRGTLRVYSLKYKALMEHSIEKGQDFSFEDLNAINYYLAINIIRSTMSIKIRTEVIVETVSAILVPTLALLVNINYVSYILSILFYG
jgi:hypothetical protein